MARIMHCLTCKCVVYFVIEAAQHEAEGHNVVSYTNPKNEQISTKMTETGRL